MQKLEKLLKKGPTQGLEKLVQRAQDMDRLSQSVQTALAPKLAAQLLAVNLREDGHLVVVCRTSAGAARLRYEEKTILAAAKAHGADARFVKVRVGR